MSLMWRVRGDWGHGNLGWDSECFAWVPSGEVGRATFGRYLGARWMGFNILWQFWAKNR